MTLILDLACQDDAATQSVDDVSASNNDGFWLGVENTQDLSVTGPGGIYPKALLGNGSDNLSLGSPVTLSGEFTIEFWCDPAVSSNSNQISLNADGSSSLRVDISGDNSFVILKDEDVVECTCQAESALTELRHLAITRDGSGNLQLYVNATAEGTFDFQSTGDFILSNVLAAAFVMAGFRIYDVALTQPQISTDYYLGVDPPTNTTSPEVSHSTGFIGRVLAEVNDEWSPAATSRVYRWLRADDSGGTNAVTIYGATSQSYTPVTADGGKYLAVEVTASNPVGSSSPIISSYVPILSVGSYTRVNLLDSLSDLTGYDGHFLFTEAVSDTIGQPIPNPVTWKDESPQNAVDWSFFTIADDSRTNANGATLISPSFATAARHTSPTVGDTYVWMQPDGTEVSRTIVAVYDIPGDVDSDLQVIKLNTPITTIDPIGILGDSSIVSGENCLGIEADRHLNLLTIDSLDNSDITTTVSYGADAIEGGDSGKPCVVLFGTTPLLAMTNFHAIVVGQSKAVGPNPSSYIDAFASLAASVGESITVHFPINRPVYRPAPRSSLSGQSGIGLGIGI